MDRDEIQELIHDLNNKMQLAYMTAEMLGEEGEKINNYLTRMTELVKQISNKMKNGNKEITIEKLRWIEIKKILNRMKSTYGGVNFSIDVEDSFYINVDKDKFQRVLENCIENAKKALAQKIRISIKSVEEEELLIFRVGDDGDGMTKEQLKKLATGWSTRKDGGLGTKIIKNYIREVRGDISWFSEKFEYTICTITIPKKYEMKSNAVIDTFDYVENSQKNLDVEKSAEVLRKKNGVDRQSSNLKCA